MSALLLRTTTGSATAARRKRVGDSAEAEVQRALDSAARAGLAWITKRPTPVRVTSVRGGRVTGFFERSPGVDYCGTLRGGRAVYLEVKSCARGTLSLDVLEREQREELARVAALGAVAAVVVRWRPPTARGRAAIGGREVAWCVVPWSVVAAALGNKARSLDAATLARFSCDAGRLWVELLEERP